MIYATYAKTQLYHEKNMDNENFFSVQYQIDVQSRSLYLNSQKNHHIFGNILNHLKNIHLNIL